MPKETLVRIIRSKEGILDPLGYALSNPSLSTETLIQFTRDSTDYIRDTARFVLWARQKRQ